MNQSKTLEVQLRCTDLSDSALQAMTRDLARSLRSQNVGTVSLPETVAAQSGSKGDPVTIGNIVLALLGSGGVVVSLVQVLKVYAERKATLHFELTRPDGKKLELTAENLAHRDLQSTTQMMEQFIVT